MLPTKFESREALGSEMLPELALLVSGLGTKPAAAITWTFPSEIIVARLRRRAENGPSLGRRSGARSPPERGRVPESPAQCRNSRNGDDVTRSRSFYIR